MIGQIGKMAESIVFHKSIKGASHILSGKPCQDYSGDYHDDDIQILVVCDGHGGNTYFRSDVGAKLATEITIQTLTNFARCVFPSTFEGSTFSITAQPKKNPFIDIDGKKVSFDELSGDQKKLALQAQAYFESESKCLEQQAIVKDLLSQIYTEWLSSIGDYTKRHPFNKEENRVLYGQHIEKAYGCTLLAFLQTNEYWLAFHIGDGKIWLCDHSLKWSEPVPEDCACFLNYTTSLCDINPLIEFRYAFNGNGEVPLAVMLCSDGLEGSLRSEDNVHDFYEQIINLCLDGDDVASELETYLPSLSETGNKDDISLAGMVSMHGKDANSIRKKIELKQKERTIRSEYRNKKNEIESLRTKLEVLKIKFEKVKDNRFMKQTEVDEMRQLLKNKETEISELDKSVDSMRREIETLSSDLRIKESDFDNWKFTVKNEMAELESEQNELEEMSQVNNHIDFTNW